MQKLIAIAMVLFVLSLGMTQMLSAQCTGAYTFEDDGTTIDFFDQSAVDPGDVIVAWFWTFGDGASSNVQNPTHTFPEVADYDVCLTITTQNGCSNQICQEIQICVLQISGDVGTTCNGDNEIEVSFTVSDPFDEAIGVNISLDGNLLPGSPFDIDDDAPVSLTVFVPGDGLQHTIFAQSEEVGHCNAEFTFTVPDCTSECFLSALQIQFSGSETHFVQIGDNFFSPENLSILAGDIVHWDLVGDGHSTTSDATSGPDSWNSGVLGQGASYEKTITNPGVHPYYCIPHGGPGGVGMSATIVANCPPGNNFDLSVTFNTSVADPQGFNVFTDGVLQPGSPFSYDGIGTTTINIAIAGDGAVHNIEIQDVADPTCTLSGSYTAPDCGAAPTCSLSVQATQTGGCTPQDEIDVQVTVTSINGGAGGFNVLVDGVQVAGPVFYDGSGTTTTTIQVSGDGMVHTISVQDVDDPSCSADIIFTSPNCTSVCELANLTLSTGTSVTHQVAVQDFAFVPQHIAISSGDIVEFNWAGDVEHTSTSDATTGPDSWDSGLLGSGATFQTPVLSEGVHPYYCIPHGGPGGVGMSGTITVQASCTDGLVPVAVSFTESGGGFGGFQVLVDGVVAGGPFAYDASGANTATVDVPGDGMEHAITVQDIDDPACLVGGMIATPDCDASTCQLTVSAQEVGACADGQVPVELTVTDIGGGAGGFEVTVDGVLAGTYTYSESGTTITSVDINGDGQSHAIEVLDVDDGTCIAQTLITTTDCTVPCDLSDLSLSTGSAVTHQVSVEDFAFVPQHIAISSGDIVEFNWVGDVEHTSTSDATTGPDSWDSGLLGNGATFQTPVLSEGVHPYYCIPHGGPGGVGMSGTITVQASCTNGMVDVLVSFLESGGGFSGFQVMIDQNVAPGGPFTYDPSGQNTVVVSVPGDGQSHQITVKDVDNPACALSASLVTPDCDASVCQLGVEAALDGSCNDQDSVSVLLTVSDLGGSASGFRVRIDGSLQGSYNYDTSGTTEVTIVMAGDGQAHTFLIEDIADQACIAVDNLQVPDCSLACQIFGLTASFGEPATHVVEVRDFEFAPSDVTVSVGDTVRFVWVGEVAHTTTSDATSGSDVWDSGLLEQGATYDVVISSAGEHLYYCIPHGGPGGVGMSGTITAVADCDSGNVTVLLSFTAPGGAQEGFLVTVDGDTVPGWPFPYAPSGPTTTAITIPGDGQQHAVVVTDAADSQCYATSIVETPDCDPVACTLVVDAAVNGGCTGQNNIPVSVTVTSSGSSGEGFNLFADGILQAGSPFAYDPSGTTEVEVLLPGDGQQHQIFIFDAESVNCTDTTSIVTPDCGEECALTNFSIAYAAPSTHVVEVRDFEFFPDSLGVFVGDTVRFVWTGEVAHTATSDATTGPDVFDSGLWGNGHVFDVVLTTDGTHPYYCIPHGAPGGIGMSGIIEVLEMCAGGEIPAQLSFEAVNGSFEGYTVDLDGQQIAGPNSYSGGAQILNVNIPGDGREHHLVVSDASDGNCTLDTTLLFPDCRDACFGFASDFTYVIDYQTLTVDFSNTSSPEASMLTWTFGDGTTSQDPDPQYQYDSAAVYEVCLIADNGLGCVDTSCQYLTLGAFVCKPGFLLQTDGLSLEVRDTSITSIPVEEWIWSFGDGTASVGVPSAAHQYDTLGLYEVCLTIRADSCVSTNCQMVDMTNPCLLTEAAFTFTTNGSGDVQFENHSTGNITSVLWGFGDGDISTQVNPLHTYRGSGLYTVCLLVLDNENNCNAYVCEEINIVSTGISELPDAHPLTVFPNPASDETAVVYLAGIDDQDLNSRGHLRIITMTGHLIAMERIICAGPTAVDLPSSIQPGMYVVQLQTEKNTYTGKLIVQ